MKNLKKLFENNEDWVKSRTEKEPDFFQKNAKGQAPKYLWIGCSDSRVPANEIVGLDPGELFVHRNVANLCIHTDFSCLSVLEFAVNVLKIEHVIVCGHYNCGGVKASMEDHQFGLIDNWLRNIRDVYSLNAKELDALGENRFDRLVELNVIQQAKNVCYTTIIQRAWQRKQPLTVHGWVYDLNTGKLIDLDCTLLSMDDVEKTYHTKGI